MQSSSRNSVEIRLLQVWTNDQTRTVRAFTLPSPSPLVAEACGDATPVAVETGGRPRAARDINGVGDVDDVQRGPPALPFVVDGGVAEHHRRHDKRVRGVGERRTDVAYAAAEPESAQRPVLERIVAPGRRHLMRRV